MLKLRKSKPVTAESPDSHVKRVITEEFDKHYYCETYGISEENDEAIDHFLTEGWKQGYDPCDWFSVDGYLKLNPDIKQSGVNPFFHYVVYGKHEHRLFKEPDLDIAGMTEMSPIAVAKSFANSEVYTEAQLAKQDVINNSDLTSLAKFLDGLDEQDTPHPFIKFNPEASVCFNSGMEGCITGWMLSAGVEIIWAEDKFGALYFIDALYKYPRQDVFQAFQNSAIPVVSANLGFAIRIQNIKAGVELTFKGLSERGIHKLASVVPDNIGSNPVDAAKWLFGLPTPMHLLSSRLNEFDGPIIANLMEARESEVAKLPHRVYEFGVSPSADVSIIIPLYGRIDFMESQLLSFADDPYIKEKAQLIFVVDDPNLLAPIRPLAENLHKLYKMPFKLIWGGVNRGFSGANNLGAEYADAPYLLFLNSDVFPQQPGWLESLKQAMESNEEIGVITPRLVFADGSIQHAGMTFLYRTDLNIWINHHPNMGLDPELDPNKELTFCPSVTGACMLMRRVDFDNIGGWSTDYLIGDFEDSDLCLKIRNTGKEVAYLPTVELTHLERQSFGITGTDDFRTKVVILNATKHQSKWRSLIESPEGV
ncbi:MAG: hypothetical protein CL589_21210 [Alteromonadaceae bacterium]|nr:hypothetical protein [Alteromonadaceae bacterium]